jgi:hypothetical protein
VAWTGRYDYSAELALLSKFRLKLSLLVAADVRTDGEASAGGDHWHAQECRPLHPTHVLHHRERQVRYVAVFSSSFLPFFLPTFFQFSLFFVSMRIRIKDFTSVQIRIRIYEAPNQCRSMQL